MFIKGIQITLYSDDEDRNYIKTDLMAIYIDDITGTYDGPACTIELKFSNFQIDNQLYTSGNYDFPVVLSSQIPHTGSLVTVLPSPLQPIDVFNRQLFQHRTPVCSIHLTFFKEDDFSNRLSLDEIYCNIQPIRTYIEDKYINLLLDFMVENLPGNLVYTPEESIITREYCEAGQVLIPKTVLLQASDLAEPFKLRHIRIEPLSVLLSVHTCMR